MHDLAGVVTRFGSAVTRFTAGDGDPLGEGADASVAGWISLKLTGDFDLSTVLELQRRLETVRARSSAMELDLSEIEFIDSSGMALLIRASRAAKTRVAARYRPRGRSTSPTCGTADRAGAAHLRRERHHSLTAGAVHSLTSGGGC